MEGRGVEPREGKWNRGKGSGKGVEQSLPEPALPLTVC